MKYNITAHINLHDSNNDEVKKLCAEIGMFLSTKMSDCDIMIEAGPSPLSECDCSVCTARRNDGGKSSDDKSYEEVARYAAYMTVKSSDPALIRSINLALDSGMSPENIKIAMMGTAHQNTGDISSNLVGLCVDYIAAGRE